MAEEVARSRPEPFRHFLEKLDVCRVAAGNEPGGRAWQLRPKGANYFEWGMPAFPGSPHGGFAKTEFQDANFQGSRKSAG